MLRTSEAASGIIPTQRTAALPGSSRRSRKFPTFDASQIARDGGYKVTLALDSDFIRRENKWLPPPKVV